ncbi:hypothetical protein [Bradyrhizobium sp. LM2.3]
MRLVQDTGEPEAFEDTFDPLISQCCGKQCDGLRLVNGEANVTRALQQSVEQ